MRRDDWLIRQLPVGMTEDDFFVRFVSIFQHISSTVFEQIDTLPVLFDTAVAPDPLVRAIGAWVGLDWVDESMSERDQRMLVRSYSAGLQWRGTRHGLAQLLHTLTGHEPVIEDSGGVYLEGESPRNPPHVRISLPGTGHVTPNDLLRMLREELPALTTFELVVDGKVVQRRTEVSV